MWDGTLLADTLLHRRSGRLLGWENQGRNVEGSPHCHRRAGASDAAEKGHATRGNAGGNAAVSLIV